nr:folate-binding protein [Pseudoxanthomonas dokdonensis]
MFAQAQFANDVTALAPGHWQWNTWLTPKGRVIALFALLKLAEDDILLLLLDMPADEFVVQLRRFVFRRKLDITVLLDWQVNGDNSPSQAGGARILTLGEGHELDMGTPALPRRLRLQPLADAAAAEADHDWRRQDLSLGVPRLGPAQRERWTPQQLSLDRLQAFSVKKGCYPGQEIVARTHFLGKAKRGLVLFQSVATIDEDMPVNVGETPVGDIVCVDSSASAALALAVMPREQKLEGLNAGGHDLTALPLLDGLAR